MNAILGGIILVIVTALMSLLACIPAFLMGFPVKWLWNIVASQIHVPEIGYWHAVALYFLCYLLFKNSSSSQSKTN